MSGLILLLVVLLGIALVRALARSMREQELQHRSGATPVEEDDLLWLSTAPPAATAPRSHAPPAPPRPGTPPATARPARRAAASAAAAPLPTPARWARELLRRDRHTLRGAMVLRTILDRPRSLEPYDPDRS